MHFDDIRCIDKMRIIEGKGYIDVLTKRIDIENAFNHFLNFWLSENVNSTCKVKFHTED